MSLLRSETKWIIVFQVAIIGMYWLFGLDLDLDLEIKEFSASVIGHGL